MTPGRHVIVAGAGIAGLSAALALARAGLRVSVLERAARLEETGAGIQLSPNAVRVLTALGVMPRLKDRALVPQAIRVMAGRSAREILRIPLGETAERRYGAPFLTMHRADLQAALVEAANAEPDISLKLAHEVVDYATHDRGITVQARRGQQIVDDRAIALIGADGIWSHLRGRLGHHPPRFARRTAWRALLATDALPNALRGAFVHLWLGPDAHLVHYPVKGGALTNIVAIVHEDWNEPGWSAPGDRQSILRHFARWSWAEEVRALLSVPPSWLKWALYDDHGEPAGNDGPVTLIGDAAHPMLPFLAQGAGMAIEDAAVLAAMLARYGDDPTDALRGYEGARRHRIARAQAASRRQGRIYAMSGPEALLRNLAMTALGGEKLRNHYDWLYSWQAPTIAKAQGRPS